MFDLNNLSVFLYLADRLPVVGVMFIVIAVILGFCCCLTVVVTVDECQRDPGYRFIRNFAVVLLFVLCLPMLLVGLAVPSTETMYLIAGSEASEFVVNTERGQEIIDKITEAIDAKITEFTSRDR